MRFILKLVLGLLVAVVALAGFSIWKPVTASRLIWPALENWMLREPFVGVTTDGQVQQGLYPLKATGASSEPVVVAARAFIASVDEQQRRRLLFPVDDLEWRRWANIHISTRQGVGFLEMSPDQETRALNLLAASLSARGLQTSRDIMRLEGHLADLMEDHVQYGEKRYWLTIMGTPSLTEPWGWQIDGHHLIINYFMLGDQVVMTPTFMGSEPPRATVGRFAGTAILEEELSAGLSLINSLNPAQKKAAVLSAEKTGNNNRGELFQDNAVIPYAGIRLAQLTTAQRELALKLIRLYVDNMAPAQADLKMAEIVRHWDETHLAWVGDSQPDSVFYYRIHSPVLMIEFDHQRPVALDGPDLPSRDHIHTVVRTPNGNDYGKDLLRAHYLQQEH